MARESIVVDPVEDDPTTGGEPAGDQDEPQDSPELPEKFRGKSIEDIQKMYLELESETGRLRNDLGQTRNEASTWRSLAEEGIAARRGNNEETHSEPVDISSDDLFADPRGSISKLVEEVLEKRLTPVNEKVTRIESTTEADAFVRDYPDYVQTGNDPEFQKYVAANPRRVATAQRAIKGDVSAMRDLMEGWEERKALVAELTPVTTEDGETGEETAPRKPTGVEGARKVATDKSGSGGATKPGKIFHQSDVVKLILNDPEKYRSEAYQKELTAAMREGRYKK